MSTFRKSYKNQLKRFNNSHSNSSSTSVELTNLVEMFPDWEADELQGLLSENDNSLEIVIDLIVNNKVSKWEPIKKEKHKKKEKETEDHNSSTNGSTNSASTSSTALHLIENLIINQNHKVLQLDLQRNNMPMLIIKRWRKICRKTKAYFYYIIYYHHSCTKRNYSCYQFLGCCFV